MAVTPRLCIVDASVLIDFEQGGLVKEIFQLQYEWAAPDAVIEEVGEHLGSLLISFGLKKITLGEVEVQEVLRLREICKQISLSDLFCLVLSKVRKTTLVTGDGPLRRAAYQEGVKVRGTLGVLDELFKSKIITGSKAAESLDKMIKAGSRFPKEECTKRRKLWLESI